MSKTITITGASSEIGMAIISSLCNDDHEFILQTYSDKAGFRNFLKEISNPYKIIKSDFTNKNDLEHFARSIKESDVLINVAGSVRADLLPMLEDNDIDQMLDVNIRGLIKTCKSVIPYMSSVRKGCIINISSIAAGKGNRGQTVYAGTKGFVESFSRSLAAEYGSRGIRVNCVAPGAIEAGSMKEILQYAPDEIKKNMLSKRLGKPDDVANVVAFLISEEAEFINGQTITVDGGFMKGL